MENKPKFEKNGIILVNKKTGVSSNKVVNIVKHAIGANKCGHLGTLDLEGEGLLPVTVNKGTKLFDFFLNKDKTYETIFVFGFETDTLDMSGEIIKEKECDVKEDQVREAIKSMIGTYSQMPPLYSAKKVGGVTAYKAIRSGGEIKLSPKDVTIYDFKLLKKIAKNKYKFEISCSSGTYIRSVCRDLAQMLGTYGSMQCILRTRCGKFYLKDASTIEEIEDGKFNFITCDKVFDLDKIFLNDIQAEKLLNGQTIDFDDSQNFGECSGNYEINKTKANKIDDKICFGDSLKNQNAKSNFVIDDKFSKQYSDGKKFYRLYSKDDFLGVGLCEDKKLKIDLRLV